MIFVEEESTLFENDPSMGSKLEDRARRVIGVLLVGGSVITLMLHTAGVVETMGPLRSRIHSSEMQGSPDLASVDCK